MSQTNIFESYELIRLVKSILSKERLRTDYSSTL